MTYLKTQVPFTKEAQLNLKLDSEQVRWFEDNQMHLSEQLADVLMNQLGRITRVPRRWIKVFFPYFPSRSVSSMDACVLSSFLSHFTF